MTPPARGPSTDPRRWAFDVLRRLEGGSATLNDLLEREDGNLAAMAAPDRSLAYALVYGVLRWRARLDWTIASFSKRPFQRLDPSAVQALRLGLFQILFLDRVPPSAAVNTSVDLVKAEGKTWLSGFVNALLRRAVREAGAVQEPDPAADPAEAIAVAASCPVWLVRRWIDRFGAAEAERLCRSLNAVPPLTLRVNTLKADRPTVLDAMRPLADTVEPTRFAPEGVRLTGTRKAVEKLPGFAEGWYQVQDEAAQLVGCLLDPRPGESVLDACAGLGGKTGHIAQRMENRGTVVAVDKSGEKLKRLRSEMDRLGASLVKTCRTDLDGAAESLAGRRFHRVLLDAPCSGLGVLRRNPDAKWSARKRRLSSFARRQDRFLRTAAAMVRPGGVLVYAVCSMEPEETRLVADRFMKERPEFTAEIPPGVLSEQAARLLAGDGTLETFPHRHDMDGFFAVRFRRLP